MKQKLLNVFRNFNYEFRFLDFKFTKEGAMEYYTIILDDDNFITLSCTSDPRNNIPSTINFYNGEYGNKYLKSLSKIDLDHSETEEMKSLCSEKYAITTNLVFQKNSLYVANYLDNLLIEANPRIPTGNIEQINS